VRFTAKERDAESGFDYFGARYFSAVQGRYTTPDWSDRPEPIPYADLREPQTANLYTFGRNNPLAFRDVDGHCIVDGENHGWAWCVAHTLKLTETQREQQQEKEETQKEVEQFLAFQKHQKERGNPEVLDEYRAAMSRPSAIDEALNNLFNDLYRPGAKVGSGSTAAAIREELKTGVRVGGRSHIQKAHDYIRALEDWLTANPDASGDRAAAENVLKDLKNALSGK
jgi:RHS repeat-associated protein